VIRDSQAIKGFIMSRIGKKPIALPAGVKYTVSENGNTVLVEGPKGKVSAMLPGGITLVQKDGNLITERQNDKQAAFHGLARALVFNAVTGVTTGWTKDIDIVGIGYRAELKGKNMVVFTLGYSHPIEFPLPTGISVEIDPKQTHLTISGIDRQKVGQIAADMRSLRKPDPYKNKGVRYTGEKLKKKVGKTGAK
jgi:large subunit ribosomal protein L6